MSMTEGENKEGGGDTVEVVAIPDEEKIFRSVEKKKYNASTGEVLLIGGSIGVCAAALGIGLGSALSWLWDMLTLCKKYLTEKVKLNAKELQLKQRELELADRKRHLEKLENVFLVQQDKFQRQVLLKLDGLSQSPPPPPQQQQQQRSNNITTTADLSQSLNNVSFFKESGFHTPTVCVYRLLAKAINRIPK